MVHHTALIPPAPSARAPPARAPPAAATQPGASHYLPGRSRGLTIRYEQGLAQATSGKRRHLELSPCYLTGALVCARRPGQPRRPGVFPSVATLVRYTGLSERTVRTCLDRLQATGIIWPYGPDILAVRIKRADWRPQART